MNVDLPLTGVLERRVQRVLDEPGKLLEESQAKDNTLTAQLEKIKQAETLELEKQRQQHLEEAARLDEMVNQFRQLSKAEKVRERGKIVGAWWNDTREPPKTKSAFKKKHTAKKKMTKEISGVRRNKSKPVAHRGAGNSTSQLLNRQLHDQLEIWREENG